MTNPDQHPEEERELAARDREAWNIPSPAVELSTYAPQASAGPNEEPADNGGGLEPAA